MTGFWRIFYPGFISYIVLFNSPSLSDNHHHSNQINILGSLSDLLSHGHIILLAFTTTMHGVSTVAISKEKQSAINCRYLLALYLVIPVILSVIAADMLVFDQYLLKNFVPSYPAQWAFWTVIFNIPHIVASWVTFAEKEYLHHYRKLFSRMLPLFIIMIYLLHHVAGDEAAFIVFAAFTMHHVLSQQFGLTLMMLGVRPDKTFQSWRWLSIIGSVFIYSLVYGSRFYPNITIYNLPIQTTSSWVD